MNHWKHIWMYPGSFENPLSLIREQKNELLGREQRPLTFYDKIALFISFKYSLEYWIFDFINVQQSKSNNVRLLVASFYKLNLHMVFFSNEFIYTYRVKTIRCNRPISIKKIKVEPIKSHFNCAPGTGSE